jgi:hypothetical protein
MQQSDTHAHQYIFHGPLTYVNYGMWPCSTPKNILI